MTKPQLLLVIMLICLQPAHARVKPDKGLIAMLDTIYHDDQDDRIKYEELVKKDGFNPKDEQELAAIISRKDSINIIKIEKILDKYGWVGPDVFGKQGSETVFSVIQHADIKTQEKYLPIMRNAVKNKKADPGSFAMLQDRVSLREGKGQIYGSQIGRDEKGVFYVDVLNDPDNVDKRRVEVGLEPLASYVQDWNIKWDVATYKKQLPEIKKRHKEMFGN
jgi:hypothetical protein